MKHQMITLLTVCWFLGSIGWAQDQAGSDADKARALSIAESWAQGGTTNDVAGVVDLLPRWEAFYEAFNSAIGQKLESEVAEIRNAWRTESFCDAWLRDYRQSCHGAGLEFMFLKPIEVTAVVCGATLGEGVHEAVCNAEVKVMDGRGQEATMLMLLIRDHQSLWLADAVNLQ